MILTVPCPEHGTNWPSGVCCSLAADHQPNLSPSGPHCPTPLLLPATAVRYPDPLWAWTA